MSEISLTASMRSNLLSLQNTQSLMDQTQERLSTGKKVNSAIDNPSSYYTAQSLTNRASDLSSLLDSMGQAVQTIQAANEGIEAITSFAQQAKAIANSALDTSDAAERASYMEQFNAILDQIDGIAKDSGYKGVNLLAGGELKVKFNEKGDSSLTITGENASAQGLGLTDAADWGKVETATTQAKTALEQAQTKLTTAQNATVGPSGADYTTEAAKQQAIKTAQQDVDTKQAAYDNLVKTDTAAQKTKIEASIGLVDAAISTLRTWASDFGNNYSIVQSREDFTENLINVLTEGADKLTLADMNEESANMLALQTRQQLAINSLSLASQAAQSVLQLF